MALEVNFDGEHAIFVGEDKTLRFFVTTGMPVVLSDIVEEGDTSITVNPLKDTMANGALIRFGKIILTTTAERQAGDTNIPVVATTGNIADGSIGRRVQNITGWTFDFKIKVHPEATNNVLSIVPTISSETNGVVDVDILDTATDIIVPKKYTYKLRRADAGFENVLSYGVFHLRG
jgi:hypothetical protein